MMGVIVNLLADNGRGSNIWGGKPEKEFDAYSHEDDKAI